MPPILAFLPAWRSLFVRHSWFNLNVLFWLSSFCFNPKFFWFADIKCDGTRHQKRLKSTESSTIKHQVEASKSIPLYNDNVTATSIAESTGEHHRSIEHAKSTINNEVSSETVYNVGDEVRNEETAVSKDSRIILLSASKTSRSRIHSSIQAQIRTNAQGISHSVTYTTVVVPQKA